MRRATSIGSERIILANKTELLGFLDRKVFNPILHAKPEDLESNDRKKLEEVQEKTRSERERFHHYGSAREIVDNYKSDLTSSAAKNVNRKLDELKLPMLPSVKEEFLRLAGEKDTKH